MSDTTVHDDERRQLQRQVESLRRERDSLAKRWDDLHASATVKYAFIQAHQGEFPVRMMCRVLKVAPSGYYKWLTQPQTKAAHHQDQ